MIVNTTTNCQSISECDLDLEQFNYVPHIFLAIYLLFVNILLLNTFIAMFA
jgi:hypothetical protein